MWFPALRLFSILTLLTGLAYPLLMTRLAQTFAGHRANGSLIERGGRLVGSHLIAQKFDSPARFHPRPSAVDYHPLPSGGSNWGPLSADLVKKREERRAGPDGADSTGLMLTASGSGLDPDLTPAAARAQIPRIAQAWGGTAEVVAIRTRDLEALIAAKTKGPQFGVFGDARVNVLELNLELENWVKK